MFELRDVVKGYGDGPVLNRIGLDVPAERTTVLIGPSGCGKSTLIRLMLGLIAPDAGRVAFRGTAISRDSAPLLRRRMGYVIQGGALFPHLSARGNVALMARYLRWPATRIHERLKALAGLVHLPEDLLERYPVQLSGGQRQRVALMRALMLDPDVLLLDEPFTGLDPMVRYRLQTDLREIFGRLGKTVVMVTHDIGEAGYFGDLVVLLNAGRIVQQGAIGDLVRAPAEPFVERFVSAQRTLLDTLSGEGR